MQKEGKMKNILTKSRQNLSRSEKVAGRESEVLFYGNKTQKMENYIYL